MDQLLKKREDVKFYMAMFEQLEKALENDEKAKKHSSLESSDDEMSYIGSSGGGSLDSSPVEKGNQITEEKNEEDISIKGESRNSPLSGIKSQKPYHDI